MTRINKECYERGCACYDDRLDEEAVEVVQRTWVGLTDEEVLKFQDIVPNTLSYDLIEFAQAIEAKLKEKNE